MNGCAWKVHGLSLAELEELAATSDNECEVTAAQMAIAEWHRHNEEGDAVCRSQGEIR